MLGRVIFASAGTRKPKNALAGVLTNSAKEGCRTGTRQTIRDEDKKV
jgi:hypothetical protein